MSQFLIRIGEPRVTSGMQGAEFLQLSSAQPLVQQAARELLDAESLGRCWQVVGLEGDVANSLFTSAMQDMGRGLAFNQTTLARLLDRLSGEGEELIAWYSDDWKDIPLVDSKDILLESTQAQLLKSSGEVYVHFRPTKSKDEGSCSP